MSMSASGGLHLVGSDCIIVLVELHSKVIGVLPGWLNPFTEALLGDWIILLVVHTSDGSNVWLLQDLSNDLVVLEDILIWDFALMGLVEDVVMMFVVTMIMSIAMVVFATELLEQIGNPAGIDGSEEG